MSQNGYKLFFGKQSPFSHHHACRFRLEDHVFHCMEQYMMYKKAEVFKDENIMQEVLKSKNPGDIKRLGRQVKGFDILTWMKVAVDIVKKGNSEKFWQNEDLYWALHATYPKQLVEASPSDTRWGIGLSADNPDALDESKWRGRNLLGKLLTNLRDELMMGDGDIQERTLPLLESDQSDIEQELLKQNEREKSRYGSRERGQNWRSVKNLQSDIFEFFWDSESPFSNYHEADFEVNGMKFCCVEHVMLYGKADLFGDEEALKTISKITKVSDLRFNKINVNPYDAKTWSKHRTDIYKHAVREKFKQNPDLMKVLLDTFPKVILRVDAVEQRRIESDPKRFKRDERRHWSEFALKDVRDEIVGKDSEAELGFNYSSGRRQSRRDQKRAGDDHKDDINKQKKAKHRQYSPDHYVNQVSSLFDEDLKLQSMESDECSPNEAQTGPSSSKNSKHGGHEKMNVDSVESEQSEPLMDWFENTSEAPTSSEGNREKGEKKQTGSRTVRENEKGTTGSGHVRDKGDKEHAGSESSRGKEDKQHTGSESSRRKRDKEHAGSESSRGKEDKQTGSESSRGKSDKEHAGSESSRGKKDKEQTGSESSRGKRDKEHAGSEKTREKRNEKGPTGSENARGKETDGRQNSQGSKETKKKRSKKDERETYNSKDRHLNTHGGTPKKHSRESSRDATSGGSDKSAENRPEEKKPHKDYRKLKLSSLPNEEKYTFIQNTDPLSFEAECKFTVDDVVFNSVNHYTAYKKAEFFGDNFRKDKIKDETDPQILRKLDREVNNFDSAIWYANHIEIHKQACKEKFSQNPDLKRQLYDTYPTLIQRSGKSTRGRVTDIDYTKLDKQDRSNKKDIENVLHDIRDELMRKEGLID